MWRAPCQEKGPSEMRVVLVGCGGIARGGYLPALGHLRPEHVILIDPYPVAGRDAESRLRGASYGQRGPRP